MSQKEPQNDEIGNPSTFINSANEKTFFSKKIFYLSLFGNVPEETGTSIFILIGFFKMYCM